MKFAISRNTWYFLRFVTQLNEMYWAYTVKLYLPDTIVNQLNLNKISQA